MYLQTYAVDRGCQDLPRSAQKHAGNSNGGDHRPCVMSHGWYSSMMMLVLTYFPASKRKDPPTATLKKWIRGEKGRAASDPPPDRSFEEESSQPKASKPRHK